MSLFHSLRLMVEYFIKTNMKVEIFWKLLLIITFFYKYFTRNCIWYTIKIFENEMSLSFVNIMLTIHIHSQSDRRVCVLRIPIVLDIHPNVTTAFSPK